MVFLQQFNIIWILLSLIGICWCYELSVVSPCNNILLESPQWSVQENVLYYVDVFAQRIFRYDTVKDEISNRTVDYGITGFVVLVKGCPKTIVVAVRSGVYLLNWDAPPGDQSLRLLSVVDVGKPGNNIDDGKVDGNGNLWFGTFGKLYSTYPELSENPDQGSLYMINRYNHVYPEVKIRPVSISNGIVWSLDNKKMYYNDSPTRKVAAYDYILKKTEIGNKTILFNFDDYDIPGYPDGITIDSDGNLWVATAEGAEVLKINSKSGKLLQRIKLPVDLVTSVMWGGKDLSILYVTTANASDKSALSGCLFAITGLGVKGRPENLFVFPNANKY